MVNFEFGIKNITDNILHSSIKKVLNKDSVNLLNNYFKLYRSNFDIKNIYVLCTKNSIILFGYKKQLFSPENCFSSIIYFGVESGNLVKQSEDKILSDYFNYVISFLLSKVFIENKYSMLRVEFPDNVDDLHNVLLNYNFILEGLLNQRFLLNNEITNGKLFSLNKVDFDYYSVGRPSK